MGSTNLRLNCHTFAHKVSGCNGYSSRICPAQADKMVKHENLVKQETFWGFSKLLISDKKNKATIGTVKCHRNCNQRGVKFPFRFNKKHALSQTSISRESDETYPSTVGESKLTSFGSELRRASCMKRYYWKYQELEPEIITRFC